jgi:8-oxo-dGTP pyrophosphatase MutT (NUDIX family)
MDETGYQAKPRNKAVIAAYLIVLDMTEGVLIARRHNTGYEDGKYNFPSGHVEEGESPTQAIIREAEEEIGKVMADELRKYPPIFRHISWRPKHDQTGDRIDLYFVHETVNGSSKIVNAEPHKCDDLRFVYKNQLPDNFVPQERLVFDVVFCGKDFGRVGDYSELGVDWLKTNGMYKL